MSMRARAITMAVIAVVLTAAALLFQALGAAPDVAETLLVSTFAGLGLVIVLRVPGNALGWLFLAIAVVNSISTSTAALMEVARDQQMLGLAKAAALASSWEWFAFIGVLPTFCLLLFPDGHLPSRRWRWVAYVAGVAIAVSSLLLLFHTATHLDVAVLDPDSEIDSPLINIVFAILWPALLACALASIASLVVRWRRAEGVARQQLKWFMFGGLLQVIGIAAGFGDGPVFTFVAEASILALPATATLAILRYRLYDIDRILSRTLSYTVLTFLLLGVYLAAVTLLTALTAPVTGDSPLAVAAATLLAAGAFGPTRRRVQGAVDRRFNRARYDAMGTAAAYRSRLRDQLDLDAIGTDLVDTARNAVQPQTAALWLRTDGDA